MTVHQSPYSLPNRGPRFSPARKGEIVALMVNDGGFYLGKVAEVNSGGLVKKVFTVPNEKLLDRSLGHFQEAMVIDKEYQLAARKVWLAEPGKKWADDVSLRAAIAPAASQ